MSDPVSADEQALLQRRRFLRSGALLAAAAGGAVVATAGVAAPASAATGDALEVGGSFTGTETTTLALDPGSSTAAVLTLTNPSGPALQLTPATDLAGDLPVGGLAATASGLSTGVRSGFDDTTVTSRVLTAYDLQGLPITFPFEAGRVLNTKDDATYATIVGTSSGAFDSQHRLKKGAWVDVSLVPDGTPPFQVVAAQITLTALGSTSAGSLVSCPPGPQPPKVATLPFDKGRTVATGTYVATGTAANQAVVRIYASATTHLKVDVTGFTIVIDFDQFSDEKMNVADAARSAQTKIAERVQQVGARARLA